MSCKNIKSEYRLIHENYDINIKLHLVWLKADEKNSIKIQIVKRKEKKMKMRNKFINMHWNV